MIRHLPKKDYAEYALRFEYMREEHYAVDKYEDENVVSFKLKRRPLEKAQKKTFTDKLYESWLEEPSAYGYFENEKWLGVIEIDRQRFANRLRITELLVFAKYRGKGIGSALMEHVKRIASEEGFREIVLETQSCNIRAIDFYKNQGFSFIGLDITAYSDDDIEKGEVRLEMGLSLEKD